MAEEKKPKIDLKARLGKSSAAGGATAGVPAPVVPPSAAGVIPPPAVGPSVVPTPGGVPVPPFVTPSQPQAQAQAQEPQATAPAVDPSDPFGAAASAPVAEAKPAQIKIELGEDVLLAQKKASGKKTFMVAVLVAIAGIGIGYATGSQSQQAAAGRIAVQGAQGLIGDIEQSQEKIRELNEKITAAIESLKERKFPENFASDLGGISIPFGADKLAGRNIGRFPAPTLQALVTYTSQVEALNERKDALRSLFTGQKQAIVEALEAIEDPKIKFSIIVQRDPVKGPVAVLAPVNGEDVWSAKSESWPAKYKIATGRDLVDVERWTGRGDPISVGAKVLGLPLEPGSVSSAFPNDVVMRIQAELMKTGTILEGRTGGLPHEEQAGVLQLGETLVAQLKRIGAPE